MFATWLFAVGMLAICAPARALHYLTLFGSTPLINTVELALRGLVGFAFVGRAPATAWPLAFEVSGWFLVGSALVLAFVPLRLHNGFARGAAARIKPAGMIMAGVVATFAAPAIIWAAL